MGAVFSMCPHLFLYPVFCILAGNLLASEHKKEFGLSQNYEFFSYKINFFRK